MIDIQLYKELRGAGGPLLLDIDIQVEEGSIIAIMGPSGAGKTSVLRMITGLMTPDRGAIRVGDAIWYDASVDLSPQLRDVGLVFQDLALFPHMTVEEQLRYAAQDTDHRKIKEVLQVMDLSQLKDQRPLQLSGGQRQRVALARSIVQRPSLLLLDEPLSALDYEMKEQMRRYIKEIHRTYQMTIILVSHDRKDVLDLCDHVYYLVEGKIARQGRPGEISTLTTKSAGKVVAKEESDGYWVVTLEHDGHRSIVRMTLADHLKVGDEVTISPR